MLFGLIEIHQSQPQDFHLFLSLKVIQIRDKEKEKEVFAAERCEDLERLNERREEA